MAKRSPMADVEEAEVLEAAEAVDAEEVAEAGDVELEEDGAGAPVAAAPEDDGINIYTALLMVSTVGYIAALVVAISALKIYSDPDKWPLW